MKYNLVSMGDSENLTLFVDGEMYVASDTHPNWTAIRRGVLEGDEAVIDLFDVPKSIERRFERLSDTITVENGVVCMNGDPIDESLSKKIVEYLDNGTDDWQPLVNFFEKVQSNPSQNSKEQMYAFLANHDYEILPDGDILGYKGFYRVSEVKEGEEKYRSSHQGTASVNDVEQKNQYIVQEVGDTVTMPRSAVDDNSGVGCSTGLHVSDFDYASIYGNVVMAVAVNPRDVVSVPTAEVSKVRVCRYVNLGIVTRKGEFLESVVSDDDGEWWQVDDNGDLYRD